MIQIVIETVFLGSQWSDHYSTEDTINNKKNTLSFYKITNAIVTNLLGTHTETNAPLIFKFLKKTYSPHNRY